MNFRSSISLKKKNLKLKIKDMKVNERPSTNNKISITNINKTFDSLCIFKQ